MPKRKVTKISTKTLHSPLLSNSLAATDCSSCRISYSAMRSTHWPSPSAITSARGTIWCRCSRSTASKRSREPSCCSSTTTGTCSTSTSTWTASIITSCWPSWKTTTWSRPTPKTTYSDKLFINKTAGIKLISYFSMGKIEETWSWS